MPNEAINGLQRYRPRPINSPLRASMPGLMVMQDSTGRTSPQQVPIPPSFQDGMSENVFEEAPTLGIPYLAETQGGNQRGLDLIHSKLGANPNLDAQRKQVETARGANFNAALSGLGTPQDAARYGRETERYEIDTPVRQADMAGRHNISQAEMAGQYDVRQQQEASRGALEVEGKRQEGIENRYNALQDLLQGGLQPGSRVSLSGVGSFSTPQRRPVPASTYNAITATRQQMEASRDSMGGVDDAFRVAYEQAVASGLNSLQVDEGAKDIGRWVAQNSDHASLDLDSILSSPKFQQEFDLTEELTPEERAAVEEVLSIVRGLPGGQ